LAFEYVEKSGICTETSYPYTGRASSCQATSCTKALSPGAVTGYHDVQQNSKEALMSALQKQPVSIAVEADQMVFQSYKSGVMTGQCGTNLDHGILAVGYGTESGTDYWLVKNSWGDVWGLQGYGKLERGKGTSGECGILMGATFPAVSGSPGPAPGPSPGPSPPAPPAPPAPSSSHYEKPPCQADEVELKSKVSLALCVRQSAPIPPAQQMCRQVPQTSLHAACKIHRAVTSIAPWSAWSVGALLVPNASLQASWESASMMMRTSLTPRRSSFMFHRRWRSTSEHR